MKNILDTFKAVQLCWRRLRRDPNSFPSRLLDTRIGHFFAKFSHKSPIHFDKKYPLKTTSTVDSQYKQLKKKSHFWKWVLRIFLGLFLLGTIFIIFIFAYFAKDLPSPGKMNTRIVAESTKILDRTGNHTLYEIHGEERRTIIPLSDIPKTVQAATISLEDQNFYSHHGLKLSSIMRAVMTDILHRAAAQGGSTITQQFVKRALLTPEKTLTRKIKEAILSIEIEQKFSKDEILGMYLNEIPYGSNAYGIESAAQTFFGKNAKDLTLDESAFLAALPQAPSYYSPYGSHLDVLIARKNSALSKMTDLGYITTDQAQEAKDVDTLAKLQPQREAMAAPHFVMYVKEYLEKTYGSDAIERNGLRVYTTLDWEKQQIAEEAVRTGAEKNLAYNAENAALVAIDPKTGHILAMVGSKNYFDTKIDGQVNVTTRLRQPGSSFKPYVYLAAFTKGYIPETILYDVPMDFATEDEKTYSPQNYDGKFHGPVSLMKALGGSLNIPAVKTLYLVGTRDAVDFAKNLGITTLNEPNRYGLSLVLGGGEVTLLDHVSAYSTLATGGVKRNKTGILKIQNAKGEILEEYKESSGERVVGEKFVGMLDSVLSKNENRSWIFGANNPLRFDTRPVVVKTGTTNDFRDAWTIGYTPSISAGVWVGNNDNSPMKIGSDGAYVAAPIWRSFMEKVLENTSIEEFPPYDPKNEIENPKDTKKDKDKESSSNESEKQPPKSDPLVPAFPKIQKPLLGGWIDKDENVKVCEIPGTDNYCIANKYCPDDEQEEKDFISPHSILYYVDKNDPRGPKPEKPERDPQFKEWEKAIQKWYDKEKDKKVTIKSPPTKDCEKDDFASKFKPEILLSVPESTNSSSFSISAKADAPYDIDSLDLFVNDEKISSTSSSSISKTYDIPDSKRGDTLTIKAKVKDKIGNEAETSKKISTSKPTEPEKPPEPKPTI